jgi:hypothetical protein
MWTGSQIVSLFEPERSEEPLADLQVADAGHPLAAGFVADEVVTLNPSESGVPATVISAEELDEDIGVPFTRGPESIEAGAPVVASYADLTIPDYRTIFATFAFYRLPEDVQPLFADNAVAWLMGGGD